MAVAPRGGRLVSWSMVCLKQQWCRSIWERQMDYKVRSPSPSGPHPLVQCCSNAAVFEERPITSRASKNGSQRLTDPPQCLINRVSNGARPAKGGFEIVEDLMTLTSQRHRSRMPHCRTLHAALKHRKSRKGWSGKRATPRCDSMVAGRTAFDTLRSFLDLL